MSKGYTDCKKALVRRFESEIMGLYPKPKLDYINNEQQNWHSAI